MKFKNIFSTAIIIFAAFASFTAYQLITPGKIFAEEWVGTSSGTSIKMNIEKQTKSTIHFGSPRNCYITFQRPEIYSDRIFRAGVDTASGGWCDNLWDGKIEITITKSMLNYKLINREKIVKDMGTLQLN